MIANALPRPLSAGSVDNAILRADGTGGSTLQNSNIVIDDVATATQDNVSIVNASSATNSALVLTPKGTGALIAGPKPDGTATGGNARGTRAVDLQLIRTAADRVASGLWTVIAGGYSNEASGGWSCVAGGHSNRALATGSGVAFGEFNVAGTGGSGYSAVLGGTTNQANGTTSAILGGEDNRTTASYSAVGGGYRSLSDRYSMQSHGAGQFAARGDAQRARFVMRNKTTTNSAVELFLDGSSTRLTIPSGKIIALTINIAGVSSTGGAVAHYMRQYCLKNVSGTCTEVYAPITIGTDNAAGTSIALSASDANDSIVVSVTGTASTIWRWVASVDAVEIGYGI